MAGKVRRDKNEWELCCRLIISKAKNPVGEDKPDSAKKKLYIHARKIKP